jgi:hypothetical protein
MCQATLALAARVGGDLGQALAISARITEINAGTKDHRFRSAITDRTARPLLDPTVLPYLKLVEEKARETGSEERYLELAMVRATNLEEASRTDEALAALDEVLARFQPRGGVMKLAGPPAVKALRKLIASAD